MQAQRVLLISLVPSLERVVPALAQSEHVLVGCYDEHKNLNAKISESSPEVVLIVADTICDDLLSELEQALNQYPLPSILFTKDSNESTLDSAVKAGVVSYIVDGLKENRIDPIIQMAVLRFNEIQTLKCEVAKVESRLNDRVIIDRAKGMLMDSQGMKEKEAYRALQKTAMDQATTIADIAEKTITVLESMNLKRMA